MSRITLADVRRRPFEARTLSSGALTLATWLLALTACVPLVSVIYMLLVEGGSRLDWAVFTELPPAALEAGGGFGNAILGTLLMVLIAAVIAVPVGMLAAVLLAETGPELRIATVCRFCARTLTGLPSILAGVFAYAMVVLTTGTYSAPAGGVALSILMLPTVILTSEEAMKMVPPGMKLAAHGMGCTRTQVVWKVVVPTALPGMITGVLLAVARAAGETAPLLFTALFSEYWLFGDDGVRLMEPTASLAVLIYNYAGMPFENQIELAWAASLVLVMGILVINVVSRVLSARLRRERRS